jgi:molybdate transport system ATP-binding protein
MEIKKPDLSVDIQKGFSGDSSFELRAEFSVPDGITILFGPSGAGKTTLLDCIAGLTVPDSGRISIAGRELFSVHNRTNLSPQQRLIGYVFQDLALFPHLTVEGNIRYGLTKLNEEDCHQRTQAALDRFRISELRDRQPGEISGGERQRVALARALVTDPCVLLLDEPLAGLDAMTKSKILDDLRSWNQAHRIPILYVTHAREEVFALGERVLVLENGRIIAQGTPHEVMSAPRQETVAQLAGFENVFDCTVMSVHEDRGTMICKLADSNVELETPLMRAELGEALRVGIRAGDILLATVKPVGLSARNILRGKIASLAKRDVIVVAKVDCGVEMSVHMTLAARASLELQAGREVWLIVKTHSCHLMTGL